MAAKTTDQKQARSSFLKGVRVEFKKIVWPTKKIVFQYSFAVIVISIICAILIWGFDYILKTLLGFIIR